MPSGDRILQEHKKYPNIARTLKRYPNIARVHADAIVHLLMVHERGLGWDYRSRGGAWPDAPTLLTQ